MRKALPPEWISGDKNSLNVLLDLGIKCPVSNLYIYRGPRKKNGKIRSKGLYCRWLPDADEDIRPDKVKFTGGTSKGKRRNFEGTTGEEDPYLAALVAIKWYKEQRNLLTEMMKELEYNSNHSLEHYWELYFSDFTNEYRDKVGGRKRITNTRSTWFAEETGVGEQPFARKCIDRIQYKDLNDYWLKLDAKGRKIGSDMAEQKRSIKTLINKLFKRALQDQDFPNLTMPIFPTIKSGSKKEAVYLDGSEVDTLNKQIIELTRGMALRDISHEQFMEIPYDNKDRINERNFVELFDAAQVMWFFYTRAEDMPRLKVEHFKFTKNEKGEEIVSLCMDKAKGNRDVVSTEPLRPTALNAVKRMLHRRKSKGYMFFDWYSRPINNPNGSQVGDTLNTLLQYAAKKAGIKKNIIWTSLRHTAFMETCKDFPDIRNMDMLVKFAANAHTSPDMLKQNYLNKLDRSLSFEKARAEIKPRSYEMFRGTGKT